MQQIYQKFPISNEEYSGLEVEFGKLAHYEGWQLKKKNSKNNCIDDHEDIVQDIRIALLTAGSYYKRQIYIESSFKALRGKIEDEFNKLILKELKQLWKDRKRHGANRQKFGEYQEQVLEQLLLGYVKRKERPRKDQPLVIDANFKTYCKTITWNKLKWLGKRITREKSWRTGLTSLSDYDYLAHT